MTWTVLSIAACRFEYVEQAYHCLGSLRRFHPDVPVVIYSDLSSEQLRFLRDKGAEIRPLRIANRYRRHRYWETVGVPFPELDVLSLKAELPTVVGGNVLWLDVDTEVLAPLDPVIRSEQIVFHSFEGWLDSFTDPEVIAFSEQLTPALVGLGEFNCRPAMYNTGVIYIPRVALPSLRQVQVAIAEIQNSWRGHTNRLIEQLAFSVVVPELVPVQTCEDLVRHFWPEKYDTHEKWYSSLR